jgi:hypothetical protein
MICSSTYNYDDVKETDQITDVKKKTKFKKLYLRRLTGQEIALQPSESVFALNYILGPSNNS